ncbi:hypothetical protein TNCV_707161 [Trichonephila clavipes]|nr:hypothetical protein TNCV_707161 [Trichonephila clavipes]
MAQEKWLPMWGCEWCSDGCPVGAKIYEVERETVGWFARRPPSLALTASGVAVVLTLVWRRPDEAHFWLNGYVNKQNCRIWSEANPQVYVETPLHPEKLTVW